MIPPLRRLTLLLTFGSACATADQSTVRELAVVQDLRIDADSQDMSPITWLAVARDGSIAVSQDQDGAIVFFGSDGAKLGSFGRKGDGPGEFRHVGRYGWLRDTLWIGDLNARRTTLVAPDRSLVRTMPWLTNITFEQATTGPSPVFFWILPDAVYPDGSLLTEPMLAAGSEDLPWPGGAQPGSPVVLLANDGSFRRVVSWLPEGNCSVRVSFQGGFGSTSIPFCATPTHAVAADGSRLAIAMPGAVDGATGSYQVIVIGAQGDTISAHTYAYTTVGIPARITDSIITRRIERAKEQEWKDAYRSMQTPDTYPPFSRVLLGRDQSTWVELFTSDGDRRWQVLDASGDIIGIVPLPRSVEIHVADANTIWGTDTDDDGLEHIVRYRVHSNP